MSERCIYCLEEGVETNPVIHLGCDCRSDNGKYHSSCLMERQKEKDFTCECGVKVLLTEKDRMSLQCRPLLDHIYPAFRLSCWISLHIYYVAAWVFGIEFIIRYALGCLNGSLLVYVPLCELGILDGTKCEPTPSKWVYSWTFIMTFNTFWNSDNSSNLFEAKDLSYPAKKHSVLFKIIGDYISIVWILMLCFYIYMGHNTMAEVHFWSYGTGILHHLVLLHRFTSFIVTRMKAKFRWSNPHMDCVVVGYDWSCQFVSTSKRYSKGGCLMVQKVFCPVRS